MDREDIIRMAREAGFKVDWQHADVAEIKAKRYEYFSALVAAAEREKLAAWMIERGYATGHGDTVEDLLKELEWQIEERIRNEREGGKQ
jgi:GH25 family lysozyme M1 (1,4-beta-N-acetylmuramidase)